MSLVNGAQDQGGEEPLSLSGVTLPVQVKVRTRVWLLAFALAVVMWIALFLGIVGLPQGLFEGARPRLSWYRFLAVVGIVLWTPMVLYYWMGWRHPRHLTADAEGIRTHSWRLRWEDVSSMWVSPMRGEVPDKKTQLCFLVEDHAWTEELRRGNRWDSGRPFGGGGWLPVGKNIHTQYATDPAIRSVYPILKQLWTQARAQRGL